MSLGTIADATVIPCAISSTRVLKAIKDRSQAGLISLVISCQKCDRFDTMRGKSQWDPQRVTRSFRNNGWEVDAEGRDARCPDCKKRRRETRPEIPIGRSVSRPPTPVSQFPGPSELVITPATPASGPVLDEVRIVSSGSEKLAALSLVPPIETPATEPEPHKPEASLAQADASSPALKPRKPRQFETKICEYKRCSASFTPTGPRQRFHSHACQRAFFGRTAEYDALHGPDPDAVTPAMRPPIPPYQEPSMNPKPRLDAARTQSPKSPDAAATAPPQTPEALKAERRMYTLLEEHYNADARHYEHGWDDARLSAESGVAEARVTFVREGLYGKAVDPFLVALREDVDAALERLKGERITLQALVRDTFDRQEKELRELQSRLAARGA